MDKTAPGKETPEVTRESLIALSYSLPEKEHSSEDTAQTLGTENTNEVKNTDGEENVEMIDTDGDEKFRFELISLSYLQTPGAEDLPRAEFEG